MNRTGGALIAQSPQGRTPSGTKQTSSASSSSSSSLSLSPPAIAGRNGPLVKSPIPASSNTAQAMLSRTLIYSNREGDEHSESSRYVEPWDNAEFADDPQSRTKEEKNCSVDSPTAACRISWFSRIIEDCRIEQCIYIFTASYEFLLALESRIA